MPTALTIPIVLAASQTGLTLTPALVNADGTAASGLTTTSLVEIGGGAYLWTGTVPDDHVGGVKFSSGATFKAFAAVDVTVDATAAAIKAKTDNLPANPATIEGQTLLATMIAENGTTLSNTYTAAAAIKAKTDNLPALPASTADVTGAVSGLSFPTLDQIGDEFEERSETLETIREAIGDEVEGRLVGTGKPLTTLSDAVAGVQTTATETQVTVNNIADAVTEGYTVPGGVVVALRYVDSTNPDDESNGIADANAWVTTDEAGANVVRRGRTDYAGVYRTRLDPLGAFYFWAERDGFNPVEAQPFIAQADY